MVWLKDGSTQCIDDIEIVELPEGEYVAVYNFEVADFHTYFVSDYDVLVHNDCKRTPKKYDKMVKHGDNRVTYTKTSRYTKKSYDITYNNGDPDFSKYKYKGSGGKSTVEIDYTGKRYSDFKAANAAAGFKKTPKGYTWHHMQDAKTMMLVETDVHRTFPHTGGFSLHKKMRKL